MQVPVGSPLLKLRIRLGMLVLVSASRTALTTTCAAEDKTFNKWPRGSSPAEIGKRVAERFVANTQISEEPNPLPSSLIPKVLPGTGHWPSPKPAATRISRPA